MAAPAENFSYDTFFAKTITRYTKDLHENFLKWRPAVEILFDRYAHSDNGGGRIWQGIAEYGQSSNVKFFNGSDTFSQEPTQTSLPIQYNWRYMGGSVSISKTEMLENSGPVALANITEGRINQVLRTMNLLLGNEIYSDGTNYGGQTITGLAAGIAQNTTAVGGLDPNSYEWWKTNITNAGAWSTDGINGSTQDLFLTTYNNCTDGAAEHPTDILCSQDLYERYVRTSTQLVRYVREGDGQSSSDLTIKGLDYHGIPMQWDRQFTTPTSNIGAYFLNRSYVHFLVDPRFKFEWTAPLSYPNQWMFNRIVGLRLALVYKVRMFNGLITFTS